MSHPELMLVSDADAVVISSSETNTKKGDDEALSEAEFSSTIAARCSPEKKIQGAVLYVRTCIYLYSHKL